MQRLTWSHDRAPIYYPHSSNCAPPSRRRLALPTRMKQSSQSNPQKQQGTLTPPRIFLHLFRNTNYSECCSTVPSFLLQRSPPLQYGPKDNSIAPRFSDNCRFTPYTQILDDHHIDISPFYMKIIYERGQSNSGLRPNYSSSFAFSSRLPTFPTASW